MVFTKKPSASQLARNAAASAALAAARRARSETRAAEAAGSSFAAGYDASDHSRVPSLRSVDRGDENRAPNGQVARADVDMSGQFARALRPPARTRPRHVPRALRAASRALRAAVADPMPLTSPDARRAQVRMARAAKAAVARRSRPTSTCPVSSRARSARPRGRARAARRARCAPRLARCAPLSRTRRPLTCPDAPSPCRAQRIFGRAPRG